jgi:K(+)-stimulated pyrophosphate-energized sodium pump
VGRLVAHLPTAVGVGVLLAILIDRLTEYFTGTHAGPVNDIKKAADTGPATLILNGVSLVLSHRSGLCS